MSSRDKLFKLMQENPNLPIVFSCSSDEVCDEYCWTFYTDFSCDVCDIYETEEQIYDNVTEITEHYQYIYGDDDLSDEEWDKKIKQLVDETPHYKAIRIFCS